MTLELAYNRKRKLIKLKHPKPPLYTKTQCTQNQEHVPIFKRDSSSLSPGLGFSFSEEVISQSIFKFSFNKKIQLLQNLAYNLDLNLLNSE
jgi:hypothetical protein